MEAPVIRAYPREAAIAAKLNAMVVLDIRNSRMKDFYDVWFMANTWTFEMATLRDGSGVCPSRSKSRSHMKAIFLCGLVIGWGYLAPLAGAQPGPVSFPLSGDWSGVSEVQGTVDHLVLHMSTTPEGKMTALLDHIDLNISGVPASSGSFDGSRLILRFSYWKPNSNGDYERRVASFEATVSASGAEMTGVWTQEGSWPLTFKRLTWQAKIPKPARPTIFDGDWAGVEHETTELEVHLFFHIHNTEDGLMVLLDCPDERFKGALASKVTYDLDSRQIWITLGQSIFTGKISADGTALDTFMTEPHFHFVIHFDRLTPKRTKPN
jgi:hypothetical protein